MGDPDFFQGGGTYILFFVALLGTVMSIEDALVGIVGLFNRIYQVAPTAQERGPHVGTRPIITSPPGGWRNIAMSMSVFQFIQ